MKRFIASVLLALVSAGAASGQESVPATRPASAPAIDRDQVDKLVRQLGHDKWAVRHQAAGELRKLGPAAVPLLAKYRNDSDPEVADTVSGIIESWRWATRGAVIVSFTDANSIAKADGFRCGDVLLKVDSRPIQKYQDAYVDSSQSHTYSVYRQGNIMELMTRPGPMGVQLSSWDFAKGGDHHCRGLAAMEKNDQAEAYECLLSAYNEGVDDEATLQRLMLLAQCNVRPAVAKDVYDRYIKLRGNIQVVRERNLGMDWAAPHVQKLLEVMKDPKADVQWRLEVYRFFSEVCPDYRMLKAIAANPPWPAPKGKYEELSVDERQELNYRCWAIGSVMLFERRFQDLIAMAQETPCAGSWSLAVRAAIELGDVDTACRLVKPLARDGQKSGQSGFHRIIFVAVLAALAADNDQLAGEVMDVATDQPYWSYWLESFMVYTEDSFGRLRANRRLVQILADGNKKDPYYRKTELAYFRTQMVRPDMTMDRWRGLFKLSSDPQWQERYRYCDAVAMMRFGRFAEAAAAFSNSLKAMPRYHLDAALLLDKNRGRLKTDWQALDGTLAVFDGRQAGSFWATKFDGKVLHVDPKGNVEEYPGLVETPDPSLGHIVDSEAGVTFYCHRQLYLLDAGQKRWVPTYAVTGSEIVDKWPYSSAAPAIARYLVDTYPANGSGREVLWSEDIGPAWRGVQVSGDIVLAVNRKTLGVVDIGKAIASQLNAAERVAAYRPTYAGNAVLIPSSRGLWLLDEKGKLSQVELPLPSQDVATVALDWPAKPGKAYVGTIPQQGGQVFEVDLASRKAVLTQGRCAMGPQDSFAAFMLLDHPLLCTYALQTLMNKPHAATATAPAEAR